MDKNENREYLLQNYDHILITASWGLPEHYKRSKYSLEVDVIKNSKENRVIIEGDGEHHSSTLAIRDLLIKKIGVDKNIIDLLIFCQDTLILNNLSNDYIGNNQFIPGKEMRRKELEQELISELYEQNYELAREFGIEKKEDYGRFVRFIPGVMTRREYANFYFFGCRKRCYDLITGSIILHTYNKLNKISKDAKRIAVIIDTTHGINYLVTALREGVLKASLLYAFNRFAEYIKDNNGLEELVLYHYNSDPLISEDSDLDGSSLTIHLLNKRNVVVNKRLLLGDLFSSIEEEILREGLKKLGDRLANYWRNSEWSRILESLLLLSRGLIEWSLRAVHRVNIPGVNDLEKSFDDIKIKFSKKSSDKSVINEYIINYKWAEKTPVRQVVEYSILANILRYLSRVTYYSDKNVYSETYALFENRLETPENKECEDFYREMERIISDLRNGNYVCFNFKKLQKIALEIYSPPYRYIIESEMENLENYLTGNRKIGWKSICGHVYKEPRGRPAYLIEQNNLRMIISVLNGVNERDVRNVYAHAGLAYKIPWIAVNQKDCNKRILCLGRLDKIVEILRRS